MFYGIKAVGAPIERSREGGKFECGGSLGKNQNRQVKNNQRKKRVSRVTLGGDDAGKPLLAN